MSYVEYTGPDDISRPMLNRLNETVNNYVAIETQLKAADGDRTAALKSWMETTELAAAVKLRTQIETAQNKLRELAESNVQSISMSDEEKAKSQAELDALKVKIKAAFGVLDNLIQNVSDDPEGVKAALATIQNPVKSNRGRKPGVAGSSLPRASVITTVNGGNLENMVYDSFTKVASVFKVDVADIQKAYAEAAGVEWRDISSVNESVTFEFQPNENGAIYTLSTKPKPRQKKTGTEEAEETSENAA